MKEIVFQKLDDGNLGTLKPFNEVLSNKEINISLNEKIGLTKIQLKALIGEIYTYCLCDKENVKDDKLLSKVFLNKLKPLKYPKQFAHILLNNLDDSGKKELEKLSKLKYSIRRPISNFELIDFVEFELLDPTYTYRQWEFGEHILMGFTNEFIDQKLLNVIEQGFKYSRLGFYEQYWKVGEKLEKSFVLTDKDKILICLIIKYKLRPEKCTIDDFLVCGKIFQNNLIHFSQRIDLINKEMKILNNNKLFKRKGKGRNL